MIDGGIRPHGSRRGVDVIRGDVLRETDSVVDGDIGIGGGGDADTSAVNVRGVVVPRAEEA